MACTKIPQPISWEDLLLDWYKAGHRPLPWRVGRDPYAIWVSEVMLQQTQVATVLPYFERWMRRFPTIHELAAAQEQEALALWQGLGYYRRCRNLLVGAKWIVRNGLPQSMKEWLQVPGVGRYTAAAIASIAFDEPTALVDGNVERVFSRLTACKLSGSSLRKAAWDWTESQLHSPSPGDWNQALMELGATVCTPRAPKCALCPIQASCKAFSYDQPEKYPVPISKRSTVQLRHAVWAPFHEGCFGLRQIPPEAWWQGMWEFPRVDCSNHAWEEELFDWVGDGEVISLGKLQHAVTHHRITLRAWLVKAQYRSSKLTWIEQKELPDIALPSAQRRVLQKALAFL